MITIILSIVAGFVFGALFTRKNTKLVEKALAETKAAAAKAEAEAQVLIEKAKAASATAAVKTKK